MSRARRVAIIGTSGFQRSDGQAEIECFSWNRVTNIANPSDYDAIVLNLISLEDPKAVNWDGFFNKFTVLTTLDVLAHGGRIVIIGDPRFWPNEPKRMPGDTEVSGRQFLSWTGLQFDWDEKPGKTMKPLKRDPSIERYLIYVGKISHWDYCLTDCTWPQEILEALPHVLDKTKKYYAPEFSLERICENRYEKPIVFAVKLKITEKIKHGMIDNRPGNSREGRIIFLPQIDEPQEEVVAMVLTRILGIQVVVPEPPWASAIVAPGQSDIDARITGIRQDIAALDGDLKNAEEERKSARRCVHLLYKLGDELEEAVREVLGSLGSTIKPPTEPGKEDGWISVKIGDEILEGVLEIKGTKKDQFSEDGLRQLMEWKNRGKLNRRKKYKGIFVGNSGAEKEVSKRKAPFSPSWKKTADLDEIAALLTCDLYELYRLDCEGKLDRKKFWTLLFHTNGIFSLKDLAQPLLQTTETQA